MKSLSQFEGSRVIFKDAIRLPSFFETNLVDPARVVKILQNDPQAQIRIFYYQYLKLCFELQNVNYDLYIRKIEEIINNPNFQFIFESTDDPSIFNDTQAKSLIMEFFGVLGEGTMTVIQALSKYPILDKIFVHFFRSMMILSNVTDSLNSYLQRDVLLEYLCKNFQVEAEIHGECIRYIETDIFIYEQSKYAVYMAYMDYQNYNNSVQKSPKVDYSLANDSHSTYSNVPINNEPNKQVEALIRPESKRQNLAKDSYIASQFVDFTSNIEALTSKAKVALKQSDIAPSIPSKYQYNQTNYEKNIQPPKNIITTNIYSEANTSINKNIIQNNFNYSSNQTNQNKNYQQNFLANNPVQNLQGFTQSQSNNYKQSIQINNYTTKVDISTNNNKNGIKSQIESIKTQDYQSKYGLQQNYSTNKTKNDLIYNPKIQNSNYAPILTSPKSIQIQQNKPVSNNPVSTKNKKKLYGLNVSDEFTSEQISKHMAEPYRTNVENTKTRARNFRASLGNNLK